MNGYVGTQLVAQILAAASAAGVRTSLTLLALGAVVRFGGLELAPTFAWTGTNAGLAALLALAVFEEFVESSEDLQSITEWVNYGLRGLGGALVASGLEAAGAGEHLPPAVPAVLGFAVAAGTHHLRMRLHTVLRGLGDDLSSPRRWLVWLETGGIAGLLIAVFLAPVLALGFVLLAAVLSAVAVGVRRAAEDRLRRRSCPHCGFRARREASRCPGCRVEIVVERWL